MITKLLTSAFTDNSFKLYNAFKATGKAHHKFQQETLKGRLHRFWAEWYAQYLHDNYGDLLQGLSVETITRMLRKANEAFNKAKKVVGHKPISWPSFYTKLFQEEAVAAGEFVSEEPWGYT